MAVPGRRCQMATVGGRSCPSLSSTPFCALVRKGHRQPPSPTQVPLWTSKGRHLGGLGYHGASRGSWSPEVAWRKQWLAWPLEGTRATHR